VRTVRLCKPRAAGIGLQRQSLVLPAIAEQSPAGPHTELSGARSGHREIPTYRDALRTLSLLICRKIAVLCSITLSRQTIKPVGKHLTSSAKDSSVPGRTHTATFPQVQPNYFRLPIHPRNSGCNVEDRSLMIGPSRGWSHRCFCHQVQPSLAQHQSCCAAGIG